MKGERKAQRKERVGMVNEFLFFILQNLTWS